MYLGEKRIEIFPAENKGFIIVCHGFEEDSEDVIGESTGDCDCPSPAMNNNAPYIASDFSEAMDILKGRMGMMMSEEKKSALPIGEEDDSAEGE